RPRCRGMVLAVPPKAPMRCRGQATSARLQSTSQPKLLLFAVRSCAFLPWVSVPLEIYARVQTDKRRKTIKEKVGGRRDDHKLSHCPPINVDFMRCNKQKTPAARPGFLLKRIETDSETNQRE